VRTNSPLAITADEAALRQGERRVRGRPTAVRVRALRLLTGGAARTLGACAALVGHSPRQVGRWGATSRREGLPGRRREPTCPGRAARRTPDARRDRAAALAAGRSATRKEARPSLAAQHGIVFASLNGVWAQLRTHKSKRKTGRRRHALAAADAQEALRAGFRGDARDRRRAAGVGL
jgi:hypothetical protein